VIESCRALADSSRGADARHRAKSVSSADTVRTRAHQLFRLDWLVETRCSLQCWTIELTFTVAGNNYKRYLSRDQSVDKISRQLTVQIEIRHNRIGSSRSRSSSAFASLDTRPITSQPLSRFSRSIARMDSSSTIKMRPPAEREKMALSPCLHLVKLSALEIVLTGGLDQLGAEPWLLWCLDHGATPFLPMQPNLALAMGGLLDLPR
jgi:hypothetical protein